jgi:hypothetical protein
MLRSKKTPGCTGARAILSRSTTNNFVRNTLLGLPVASYFKMGAFPCDDGSLIVHGEKLALLVLQYVIIIRLKVASRGATRHDWAPMLEKLNFIPSNFIGSTISSFKGRVSGRVKAVRDWKGRLIGNVKAFVIGNVQAIKGRVIGQLKAIRWRRSEWATRCQTCKEILFLGHPDPYKKYSSGMGSWYGVPIAVCLGSWRNRWRRKWYHQSCCGIDNDKSNLAGRWLVFGFIPAEIPNRMRESLTPPAPVFSSKIGPPLQYPSRGAQRQRRT